MAERGPFVDPNACAAFIGLTNESRYLDLFRAVVGAPTRIPAREEAGAAMMAAVALGVYPDMEACIAEWVTPLLGQPETPDAELTQSTRGFSPCTSRRVRRSC
ncbi:Erythritol kinase EryA [Candidatus Paraburkholderia calva]|nr:Erythritol kinase EryA [Candidatus Paraburkholderia calva]